MTSNVDPCVSLLISELRSANKSLQADLMNYEIKKINSKMKSDESNIKFDVWKKLYILSMGVHINPMDFVKAAANKDLFIKRMGYQGLLMTEESNHLILMTNCIIKDLENDEHKNEAILFLGNVQDSARILDDVYLKLKIPREDSKLYCKSIAAKSRTCEDMPFSLALSREVNLYTKIQIVLDNNYTKNITENDISNLKAIFPSFKCDLLKLKTIQLLVRLSTESGMILENSIVQILENFMLFFQKKAKKKIDFALAVESAKLLISVHRVSEKLEEFVLRLISSENPNSRYIGFKLICQYKILAEIAIDRIIDLGISEKLHFLTLFNLTNKSNYKIIYSKMSSAFPTPNSGRLSVQRQQENINKILIKFCEYGDQDFIADLLYEAPQIYRSVRLRLKLGSELEKKLFEKILFARNINYFLIISDLFINQPKYIDKIPAICSNTIQLLTDASESHEYENLDHLIDFLCSYGEVRKNRELFRSLITYELKEKNNDLYLKMVSGILRFNILIPQKLVHIRDSVFIEYLIEDETITIEYYTFLENVKILGLQLNTEVKKENNKIVKVYKIEPGKKIVISLMDRGKECTKEIRVESKK